MERVQIVGILNVTPDSFHDGGKFLEKEAALKRAGEMLSEGADILEIGGESSGPGSKDVGLEEEKRRVLPVIDALRDAFPGARLAVDTYKAGVAAEALERGVVMINDVTAGRRDANLFSVLKGTDAKLVLMSSKDPSPRTTIQAVRYSNVVSEVSKFLKERKAAAVKAGLSEAQIVLDPGLGHFLSSEPDYSFEVLARLGEFLDLGSPLLVSPSRKSFLAGASRLRTAERLPGTIAASAIAVLHGAEFIRTHDPGPVRQACEIALAIRNKRKGI